VDLPSEGAVYGSAAASLAVWPQLLADGVGALIMQTYVRGAHHRPQKTALRAAMFASNFILHGRAVQRPKTIHLSVPPPKVDSGQC